MIEWRRVAGYEGDRMNLEASSDGQVRLDGKAVKQFRWGEYWHVNLPTGTAVGVHVLVLWAFKGPRPPKHVSDHINAISTDNRIENLRWATRRENLFNGYRHGHFSGAHIKMTVEQAMEAIERYYVKGERVADIALDMKINGYTIRDVLKGRSWSERLRAHSRASEVPEPS